jgi:L-asparaginase II
MTGSAADKVRSAIGAADVVLAEVTRGPRVESVHRGAVAVACADGRTWSVGDVGTPIWARSAVKPFQALPLFDLGLVDALGMGAAELALLSASHDGTERHLAVVEGLLRRGGLSAEALRCGPHAPFDRPSAREIARAGREPTRLHNNCSGKHSGFLLLAQALGAPLETYLEPDAPGQRLARDAIAAMVDLPPEAFEVAVDGCGAPTWFLPPLALARGFCRLVNPDGLPPVRRSACARLFAAITEEPVLLSGENRICAALIRSAPGRVYPKNGAEGIYAVGVRDPALPGGAAGLVVKVRDGAERAYGPVVVRLLAALGLWDGVPPGLARFAEVPVPNTQGRTVGAVRSALAELPPWCGELPRW